MLTSNLAAICFVIFADTKKIIKKMSFLEQIMVSNQFHKIRIFSRTVISSYHIISIEHGH